MRRYSDNQDLAFRGSIDDAEREPLDQNAAGLFERWSFAQRMVTHAHQSCLHGGLKSNASPRIAPSNSRQLPGAIQSLQRVEIGPQSLCQKSGLGEHICCFDGLDTALVVFGQALPNLSLRRMD